MLAKMGTRGEPALISLRSAASRLARELRHMGLANVARALGTSRVHGAAVVAAAAQSALQVASEPSPQETTNLGRGPTSLGRRGEKLIAAARREVAKGTVDHTPRRLATIARPPSTLKHFGEVVSAGTKEEALRQMHDSGPQDAVNLARESVNVGTSGEPLLAGVWVAAAPKPHQPTLQGAANTARSCSMLEHRDEAVVAEVGVAAAHVLDRLGAEDCAGIRAAEGVERLADVQALILAYSGLGSVPERLWTAASAVAARRAEAMDAQLGVRGATAFIADESLLGSPGSEEPCLLAEQTDICVLWKPPGWIVSVGNEGKEEWELNKWSAPGSRPLQEWVRDRFGDRWPISNDGGAQHGILHRLDRETSGALLVAKTYKGLHKAQLQFASGGVTKEYVCLCHGAVPPQPRVIEVPLRSVDVPGSRRSVPGRGGRPACTEIRAVSTFFGEGGVTFSLVEVRIHTGRMHQIRAHMSNEGHPLVGDRVYGGSAVSWCPRIFLHAGRLRIDIGDGPLEVRSTLPPDLRRALESLEASDDTSRIVRDCWCQ